MTPRVIQIRLKENSHKIVVGYAVLPQLGKYLHPLKIGHDAVIITTSSINKLHGQTVCAALKKFRFTVKVCEVPDGEKSKSLECAFKLFNEIACYDVQKKIFIVALGGGVIGDLSGFVASCYKRGIPYIQIPTTLLAQIDSAIGGKVAVDLPSGKNLVGAFYHPKLVLSDVAVLETLSLRQIRNGLAEAIKYGMIGNRKFFEYLEENYKKILSLTPQFLTEVVCVCSRIKTRVVMRDEKETKGIRTILNFGHTIGHAVETALRYNQYQHGEAVAVGMGVAADISVRMGLLRSQDALRLKQLIKAVGLPTQLKNVSVNEILQAMAHDKKFIGKKNRFVLATGIGRVGVFEGVKTDVIQQTLDRARRSLPEILLESN